MDIWKYFHKNTEILINIKFYSGFKRLDKTPQPNLNLELFQILFFDSTRTAYCCLPIHKYLKIGRQGTLSHSTTLLNSVYIKYQINPYMSYQNAIWLRDWKIMGGVGNLNRGWCTPTDWLCPGRLVLLWAVPRLFGWLVVPTVPRLVHPS